MILVRELLGLVGLFDPVPVALGCTAAGGPCGGWGRRRAQTGNAPPAPPQGRESASLLVLDGAVVVAAWNTRLLPALDHGMTGSGHGLVPLPQAVRFVQDGSITPVQFFETGAGTAFYPATSGSSTRSGCCGLAMTSPRS